MTDQTPQELQRPHPVLHRWGRRLAIAGAAILILAALTFFFRGTVLRTTGAPLASWAAARFAGYELRVDRLRGDPLSWIEVEGLSAKPMAAEAGAPQGVAFEADRLRIDYSLGELRRIGVGGLHSITGAGIRITGDLGGEEESTDTPWPAAPTRLPRAELEDVAVDLGLGGGSRLRLDGAAFQIEPETAGAWRLELGAPRLALELPGEGPPAAAVEAIVLYRPQEARFERFTWGEWSLEEGATVDLGALPERRIAWRATVTGPPGSTATAGDYGPDGVTTSFETESFEMARVPRWLLPAVTPALAGGISGRGRVDVPTAEDQVVHVGFDGVVEDLRVDERRFGRVQVVGAVDGAVITAESLEAVSSGNRVRLGDARLDLDADTWDQRLARSHGALEASIDDLPALLGATAGDLLDPKTGSLLRRAPKHHLELSAHLDDNTVSIDEARLETPGGRLDLRPSTIRWSPGEEPRLDLSATLDFTDLAPLGAILGTEPWSGSLRANVEAAGSWPALSGNLEAEGEGVVAAGYRLGRVGARATGDGRRLEFESLELAGPWGDLEARGALFVEQRRLEGVNVTANVTDASALAPSLPLYGSLTATATLDGTLRQLEGRVEIAGDGRYGDFWTLENLRLRAVAEAGLLRLEELDVATPLARLHASGVVADAFSDRPEAILEKLVLEADGKDLVLQQPARLAVEEAGLALDDVDLRGSAGNLVADLTHRDGVTRWHARLEGFDPMPFAGSYLPPEVTLRGVDGTIEGSLRGDALEATSTGSVAVVTLPGVGREFRAAWQGSLAGERLQLDRFQAFSGDQPLLDLSGEVPFDPLGSELLAAGPLSIRGSLTAPTVDRLPIALESSTLTLSGKLGATLELGGSWSSLEGSAEIHGEGVELELPQGTGTEILGPGSLEGRVRIAGGLVLEALSVELPDRAQLTATGRWDVPTGVTPYLEAEDVAGLVGSAPLRLDVTADAADLAWISRWLPGVRRLGGNARAEVRVAGTLDEPEVDGWAELTGGDLRLDSDVAALDALEGRVLLRPDRIEIERLTGELGAAPVRVTGTIVLTGDSPGLDLQLSGENVLLVRNDDLRLRADLDLRIDGTLAAPRARGDVGLRNSRVFYRVDFAGLVSGSSAPSTDGGLQLFSFTDPPLSEAILDLRVHTIDPVSISSNVARGGARLDLHLGGTGEVPLPRGAIFLEPTKVRLPSGVVDFNTGTVTFSRSSPFDPDLALSGEARLRGYDVALQVTGTLAEPEVLLSSTPPLSNDQLLLLVLTGQAPSTTQPGVTTASGGGAATQAAQSVALYLARDVLSRWTGQGWEESDEGFLNRLDLVVGRELSESGSLTTEASYLLRENFPNDHTNLYLVAERDAFDAYNYGLRLVFRFQ